MRRREFISLLGGAAAAAWPRAARAQREQKRRVAVLMGGLLSGDANGQAEAGALEDALQERGWRQGGNIEISYRWPGAELDAVRAAASEIAASHPDLVVSRSTPATSALMSAGLPTVFVLVGDPIRSGFVQNLARPGGNVTGFTNFEASVGGKWLELLKEAAPSVTHITLLFNPQTAPFAENYLHAAQAAAQTLGVTVTPAPSTSTAELESAVAAAAATPGGGIIAMFDTFLAEHRDFLVSLVDTLSVAGDLRQPDFRAERRADGLRVRLSGYFPPRRGLCRPHLARHPPGRSAGAGAGQIHALGQSQGRRGHRARLAAVADHARRRGDRVRRRDFIALAGGMAERGRLPPARSRTIACATSASS